MTEEEIEIVARAIRAEVDRQAKDGSPYVSKDDPITDMLLDGWFDVTAITRAAITALDQYRAEKAEADQPRRDSLFMAAGLYPFDLEKSREMVEAADRIWAEKHASPTKEEGR